MKIEDWPSGKTIPALYRELKQLDLLENLAELEAFGFTVIPPEKVAAPEVHKEYQAAALRVACERKACTPDQLEDVFEETQELFRFTLWDDRAFEKIVLTPASLGLIQWLVGTDCILSLCNVWVKGKGAGGTGVHADWAQFEMPSMAVEPFGANFNYLVTDYSREEGGLSFVPCSHRWRRWPSVEEAEYWNEHAQVIEAPAGSMVIWGDHTWHGSYAKETDGLRLMVLGMYNRPHMQTQEAYRQTATAEALARNPLRFTRLMNVHHGMPWGKSGSRYKGYSSAAKAYLSLFDTEPVGDGAELPTERDYHEYDQELGDVVREQFKALAKGKRYQFPDLYKDPAQDASAEPEGQAAG